MGGLVSTIYDLVTLVLFAGLALLFLQRSAGPASPRDRIYHYAPPAIGCAAANWLGNHQLDAAAVATLVLSAAYVVVVLKPFQEQR
jgi:hypothetical protein